MTLKRLSQLVWAVLAVLLLPSTIRAGESADAVGFVLDKSGDWIRDPDQVLVEGAELPGGAVVRPKLGAPEKNPTLVIAYYDGTVKTYHEAASLEKREGGNFVSRILSAARKHFQPIHALSRGEDLHDGVVKIANRQADLSRVFEGMSVNRYLFRLRPVEMDASRSATPLAPIAVKWDPPNPLIATVGQLTPGFYKMSLLEYATEDHEPTGDTAWLLFTQPMDYERLAASYQEAINLTKKWPDVKPDAVRGFLRAYLESLATQSNKKG